MAAIAAEQKPVALPVNEEQLAKDRQAVFDQRRVLSNELDSIREQALGTEDLDAISKHGEKAAQVEEALKLLDPEHVKKVVSGNYKQITSLNKELKAATKAEDETAINELKAKIDSLTAQTEKLKAAIPALETAPKVEDIKDRKSTRLNSSH